jgi:hypothetical protein
VLILVESIDAFLVARRLTKTSVDAAKKELDPRLMEEETIKKLSSKTRIDELKMDFIRNFMEIEKSLRETADKNGIAELAAKFPLRKINTLLFDRNLLDRDYEATLNFLMRIRSGVLHGEIVSISSLMEAYKMSNVLLKELKIHDAKK